MESSVPRSVTFLSTQLTPFMLSYSPLHPHPHHSGHLISLCRSNHPEKWLLRPQVFPDTQLPSHVPALVSTSLVEEAVRRIGAQPSPYLHLWNLTQNKGHLQKFAQANVGEILDNVGMYSPFTLGR